MRRRDERDTQRDSPHDEALLPEHAQLLKPSCWQVARARPTPFSRAAHMRALRTRPCGAGLRSLEVKSRRTARCPPTGAGWVG